MYIPQTATLEIPEGTRVFANANFDRLKKGVDVDRVELIVAGTLKVLESVS
jgi:hypothetical protein